MRGSDFCNDFVNYVFTGTFTVSAINIRTIKGAQGSKKVKKSSMGTGKGEKKRFYAVARGNMVGVFTSVFDVFRNWINGEIGASSSSR